MYERALYELLDRLPVGVFVVDATGKPIYANRRSTELIGRGLSPDIAPGDLAEVFDVYRAGTDQRYPNDDLPVVRALTGEEVHVLDLEVERPDGRRVPVEVWAGPIHDHDGSLRFAAAALEDITDRRRVETYLKLVRDAAETANTADTVFDAFHRVIGDVCVHTGFHVGHAFVRVAQDDHLESADVWIIDGNGFVEFKRATEQLSFRRGEGFVGEVFGTGLPAWREDVTLDPGFVRRGTMDVRGALGFPVLVGTDVVAVLEFFSTDRFAPDPLLLPVVGQIGTQLGRVVERVRARDALKRALDSERSAADELRDLNELKDTLLHCVSHDLRNPLTVILGTARLVERSADDPERLSELVEMIVRNAQRAAGLTRDLLDVERAQQDDLALAREPIDVGDLVERLVQELGIERPVKVSADRVRAELDGTLLQRIVENLVRNAAAHAPAGSTIVVDVWRNDGSVRLSVTDEGPGVPDAEKDRVFELFRRGRSMDGSGIGLSVVRRFAEAHGGRAWVEDTEAGGAAFHVDIPAPEPRGFTADGERRPA